MLIPIRMVNCLTLKPLRSCSLRSAVYHSARRVRSGIEGFHAHQLGYAEGEGKPLLSARAGRLRFIASFSRISTA